MLTRAEVYEPRWFVEMGWIAYESSCLSMALWQMIAGLELEPVWSPPPPARRRTLGGQLTDAVASAAAHPWGPDGSELRRVSGDVLAVLADLVRIRNRVIHDYWMPDTRVWDDGMAGSVTAARMFPSVWTRISAFASFRHVLSTATIAAQRTGSAVRELHVRGLTRDPMHRDQPYKEGISACRALISEWGEMKSGGRGWVWLDHAPEPPGE